VSTGIKKAFGLLVAGILIVVLVYVAHPFYKSSTLQQGYKDIKRGMRERRVWELMGRPTTEGVCKNRLTWDEEYLGPSEGVCIKEYRYESPKTTEVWIVGFDANGRAVSKYHVTSP
jgi:hypothetical protein